MTSLKWGYLHTHVIEKVERDKMSADRGEYSYEEKRMVEVVGGRARGLVRQSGEFREREREQGGPFQI